MKRIDYVSASLSRLVAPPGGSRTLAAGAARGLSLLALALPLGCQPKNEFVPPPPPAVTVAQPLQEPVIDYFQTTGITRAKATVELRARVDGYLEQVAFKDGGLVEKDAVLFVIDKRTYEASLGSAQAEVNKAEAQQRLKDEQLVRIKALVERKAATPDQLDVAEAERSAAAADVEASKAAVAQAKLNVEFTTIRAPFAGRMGEHLVDVGNLVQSGTTLLATLEAVDPIYAYFDLSESDLLNFLEMQRQGTLKISEADPPTIELAIGETDDYAFKGPLDFREFGVDPKTGTTVRRAVFENSDQRLIPGLFVRARAAVGEPKPRLLVEERAISSDQRGDFLLIVADEQDRKNVVEQRPVKLGDTRDGLRVILDGLKPTDWVVVNGLQRARPGAQVKPEQAKTQDAKDAAAETAPQH